ncbi:response regulator transcription factor [Clostridium oceanicum]|uniref:Stage 0 sporulation protein A homolog n=1 Tax=Clostridium oceanicum TaxID=1543 RepID=A0ABN1JPT1_9CLOT
MNKINILVVEDDEEINGLISKTLIKEGYNVTKALDGKSALEKYNKKEFQMVILDIMLPIIDGMEVMRRIREKSMIPIVILSAKGEETDRIIGLGLGADDYMVKPFSVAELIARIKAQLRRYMYFNNSNENKENQIVSCGDLTFDLDKILVSKKGQPIDLTAKEIGILKLFITNPNKIFTKAQIFNTVWGEEYIGDSNTVMVHIRRLRNKIEDNPNDPKYILTVWGIGYKLGSVK